MPLAIVDPDATRVGWEPAAGRKAWAREPEAAVAIDLQKRLPAVRASRDLRPNPGPELPKMVVVAHPQRLGVPSRSLVSGVAPGRSQVEDVRVEIGGPNVGRVVERLEHVPIASDLANGVAPERVRDVFA